MSRERRSRSDLRKPREGRQSAVRRRLARWQEERHSKSGGPGKLIPIVIVLGFIVVAAFLFWKSRAPKGPWDVNKATAAQLETLPGIGPAMAEDIIDGRPYQTEKDLLDVKGIGEKTLEKIKAGLVFPGEAPLE